MHELKFLGTNNLSAKGLFYTRKAYKEYAIPEKSLRVIDYWYADSLYGKVDFESNVVYPLVDKTNVLELVPQNTSSALCMFFVGRQIEKLKNEYSFLLNQAQDSIKGLPAYEDFQVSRAFAPIETLYESHFNEVLRYFVLEYLPHYSKCIVTFEDIVKHYRKFVLELGDKFPITRTNHILLPTTSPLISGLIVDLDYAKHSVDQIKEQFFPDCDFEAFQSLAADNGFLMNKNAPWRLTANVRSDMINNKENIFEKYYFKAFKEDLYSVFRFILNSYKLFFRKNPNIFYPVEIKGRLTNLAKRRKMDKSFLDRYGANYWLDLTYWTRLSELGFRDKTTISTHAANRPWNAANSENLDECLAAINHKLKFMDPRFSSEVVESKVFRSGTTTNNNGHAHRYEVDENGNGWAMEAVHPNEPRIKHKHKIVNGVIMEAQSSCYPHCSEVYSSGVRGVGPHIHEMRY